MDQIIKDLQSALDRLERLQVIRDNPPLANNPFLLVGRGNLYTAIANLNQVKLPVQPPAPPVAAPGALEPGAGPAEPDRP